MSEFDIFLLGLMNFSLLMAGLFWGLRRAGRQFFYARGAGLKKQMVAAAALRRQARVRAAKAQKQMRNVEEDIARRREIIVESCEQEGAEVLGEARMRAQRIVDAAIRQADEERARALRGVRTRVLARAFALARTRLGSVEAEAQRRLMNEGLAGLPGSVAGDRSVRFGGGR